MKKIFICVLITLFTFVLSFGNVYANTPITVQFDGRIMTFVTAQPVIMHDRVMVPIRDIAENLGMTFSWDPDTLTMTAVKGTRTIKHTLYQKNIIVNNVKVDFDVASVVVNERSLMPVRMLAEAIDSNVSWDQSLQRVIITSKNTQATPQPTQELVSLPKILTVAASESEIQPFAPTSIKILANSQTTRIRITDSTGKLLAISENYNKEDSETHVFNVTYTPTQESISLRLNVYAGTKTNFQQNSDKFVILKIGKDNTKDPDIKIRDYKMNSSTLTYGEKLNLDVYTTGRVSKVWLADSSNKRLVETRESSKSGTDNMWQLTTTMHQSGTYYIYAEDNSGYNVTRQISITVASEKVTIERHTISNQNVSYGQNITVKIYTNNGATNAYIEGPKGGQITSTTYNKTENNQLVWEMSFYAHDTGNYYLYAANSKDKTYKTVYITVGNNNNNNNNNNSVNISSVDYTRVGNYIDMDIYTGLGTKYVWIQDSSGQRYASSSGSSVNDYNSLIWHLTFDLNYSGTYYVYSESSNGTRDSYSLVLNREGYSYPDYAGYDPNDDSYYIDDNGNVYVWIDGQYVLVSN